MVVTLSIVAVLLAIAAPGMRELSIGQGVKGAAFDLFAALEYARSEAIKRPSETVTLKSGATTDGAWSTGWRLLDGSSNVIRSWTIASSVTVADKNGTPLTSVTFGKDGRVTATPKLEVKSTATANSVSARCIKVDLSGRPSTTVGACS
jgi:type IV fimbrial biogenesis protein FimT